MKLALVMVCSIVICAATAAAEPADTIKVLVITGGHDFDREPFFAMFQEMSGMTVVEAHHDKLASAYDRQDLLEFDAVVLYDMIQDITEAQQTALVGITQHGVGLVVMHHALVSFQHWPEYERIIGGRYLLPPKESAQVTEAVGYRHDVDMPIKIVASDHPVTRGLKDFELHDEIYWGYRVAPDATPLLTTSHPDSGNPVAWAREVDKSRVVTIQPGHSAEAHANPSYKRLVRQSIDWVARRANP